MELLLDNVKPIFFISFFSYLAIVVLQDLSSRVIVSYSVIPIIILLWVTIMTIGQIIAILTTSLTIDLRNKTGYYKDLVSKKSFSNIVSIRFNNIPFFFNDITIRDKSGESLTIKMLKDTMQIRKFVAQFSLK